MANIFDWYGFSLTTDDRYAFSPDAISLSDKAGEESGSLTFGYNGSSVNLIWSSGDEISTDSGLALLQAGSPQDSFIGYIEGTFTADSNSGSSLGFLQTASNGDAAGGGLIGAWTCSKVGTHFLVIVASNDTTTAQIRFDRIVDNFVCES